MKYLFPRNSRDIDRFCRELRAGHDCIDCAEYASRLYNSFSEGDILCLRCESGPVIIAELSAEGMGWEYYCHYVFIYNGKVYDLLHNNIGIETKYYLSYINDINEGKLRADKKHSTNTFGLPILHKKEGG